MRTAMSRIERAAGVFILLALLALLALIFLPGLTSGRLLGSYRLSVLAGDGIGLASGDRVVLQGVQGGHVREVELTEGWQVLIHCDIDHEHRERIREGTAATLAPPPVFGAPRILLTAGKGPPLPDQSILEARTEEAIALKLGGLVESVQGAMARLNGRLDQLEGNLQGFQKILDTVNNDWSGKVGRSLASIEMSLEGLPVTAELSRKALEDARKVLESLKRNILIRSNLPREEGTDMIPASYREEPGLD